MYVCDQKNLSEQTNLETSGLQQIKHTGLISGNIFLNCLNCPVLLQNWGKIKGLEMSSEQNYRVRIFVTHVKGNVVISFLNKFET